MRLMLFAISMVVGLIVAPINHAQGEAIPYTDPIGHFTVDIPASWINQSTDIYGHFSSPEPIDYYFIAIPSADISLAFESALAIFQSEIIDVSEPTQTAEIPILGSVWTQYIYADEGRFDTILGRLDNGIVSVIYVPNETVDGLQSATPSLVDIMISFRLGEAMDLGNLSPLNLSVTDYANFSAYIQTALNTFDVTGASVAIIRNGEIAFIETYGVRSATYPEPEPITLDTQFMVGTLTQPMTTMMIGTLVDDGLLDWNQPVQEIYPDFALSDSTLTSSLSIRDLVNHASGVGRDDLPLILNVNTPQSVLSSLDTLPIISTTPRTAFAPSHQMMATGGYVGAMATGASLDDIHTAYTGLMQSRIFAPIGMTNTTFNFSDVLANDNYAVPHGLDLIFRRHHPFSIGEEFWTQAILPSIGAWSSIQDMAHFALTITQFGTALNRNEVISSESLIETFTGDIVISPNNSHGMGWFFTDYRGVPILTQSGGTFGYTAEMAILPEHGIGIVILANRVAATNFTLSVRDSFFEMLYGLQPTARQFYADNQATLDARVAQAVLNISPITDLELPLTPYLGTYENDVTVALDQYPPILRVGFIDAPFAPTLNGENQYVITAGALSGNLITFSESDSDIHLTLTLSDGTVRYDKVED